MSVEELTTKLRQLEGELKSKLQCVILGLCHVTDSWQPEGWTMDPACKAAAFMHARMLALGPTEWHSDEHWIEFDQTSDRSVIHVRYGTKLTIEALRLIHQYGFRTGPLLDLRPEDGGVLIGAHYAHLKAPEGEQYPLEDWEQMERYKSVRAPQELYRCVRRSIVDGVVVRSVTDGLITPFEEVADTTVYPEEFDPADGPQMLLWVQLRIFDLTAAWLATLQQRVEKPRDWPEMYHPQNWDTRPIQQLMASYGGEPEKSTYGLAKRGRDLERDRFCFWTIYAVKSRVRSFKPLDIVTAVASSYPIGTQAAGSISDRSKLKNCWKSVKGYAENYKDWVGLDWPPEQTESGN